MEHDKHTRPEPEAEHNSAPPEQADEPVGQKPTKKEKSAWWVKNRATLTDATQTGLRRFAVWGKESFRLTPGQALPLLRDGLLGRNAALMLLGICAALAASTSLVGAVAMGAAVTAVLLGSNLIVALLRHVLLRMKPPVRFVLHVGVIAALATVVDGGMRLWLPSVADELGIFLPLVAVNGVLISRAADFSGAHTPGYALVDGAAAGVGYTAVLVALGAVREVLGRGTLGGAALFGGRLVPISLVTQPAGGFILLGLLVALVQWLRGRKKGGGAA